MFIISIKPSFKKIFTTALCIFVIVFSVATLVNDSGAATVSKLLVERTAEEARLSYIKKYKWDINEIPVEVAQVTIPKEFGAVYLEYNKLQKKAQFNLEKYKGKQVTRYSYEVKNYKDNEQFVRANLLIYKDKIIGGDICSLKLDGFMHEISNNINAMIEPQNNG